MHLTASAERATRENRQEQYLHVLAESSRILVSSLDLGETLGRVATLVVPSIADWCSIDVFKEGVIRNVAVHHVDPAKVELARRLQREYPPDLEATTGVAAVIRSGRAECYPEITEDVLDRAGVTGERRDLVRALGLRSAIVAPLRARGETLGALTLVSTAADRRYDDLDVGFAEDFAQRVAMAVDNARLHAEQADALAAADEARLQLERLQRVTEALSEAVTRTDVARALVREGLVALRAQAGAVYEVAAAGELEALESAGEPEPNDIALSGTSDTSALLEAVRTRQPVVTAADALGAADPSWSPGGGRDAVTLTVPLLSTDEPIGALHMAFRPPRGLDDRDLSLARTLARHCTQALERARLYEAESHARERAERLTARLRRLQTVVDATFLGGSLEHLIHELIERLREALGSDTVSLLTVDEEDALVVRDAVGFDGPIETRVAFGAGFAGRIAETQTSLVVPDVSKITLVSRYHHAAGIVSLAGEPLTVDGRTIGVLEVGSRTPREFDREDLVLLRLVANRAAVVIERARIHEREHEIAEILQRSLLPERLPDIEGIESTARYVAGSVGVTVGGDWYDVFELADGSVGIVVGDVVGHGVRAATAMSRLRNALRAYASEGFRPADTLARLNRLACESGDEIFATVVYALVTPSRTHLCLSSAGHPPPLLRQPDGDVRLLEGGRSLPIGATRDTEYPQLELTVAPGSDLVLYTDGLVERRGESIDVGIARLMDLVGRADGPIDRLADQVISALETASHTDDVALVAIRLERVTSPRLTLRLPVELAALAPMRSSLRTWLERHGAAADEVFDILVAVNEACSNAMEHPLARRDPEVALEAEVVEGQVSIVIRDGGRWRAARPGGDRGRGLDLMRTLVEGVEVTPSSEGTSVRLQRRLRSASE